MHWLPDAAVRAGFKGAGTLLIPEGRSSTESWEIGARALGVSPSELATRVAPAVRLHAANFTTADPRAMRLIPEKMARRFNVFPLREDDRHLVVATAEPNNLDSEQAIEFAAGRRVVFELAAPFQVAEAINTGYAGGGTVETVLSALDAELARAVRIVEELKPESVALQEAEAAPVIQLTSLILRDAVVQRASDVHIEPGETIGSVRFRIDGVMRLHMQMPMSAQNRVVSRIKVLSKLDIADRTRPQDGRMRLQIDSGTFDMRVSTVPVRGSEKAVLRVLRSDISSGLADSGMAPLDLARFKRLLSYREGIVFVTGPTGSGKTTTMYGALKDLSNGESNIMTVEDPIEYELPGISQIQVAPKRDVTFASALRAILRQDPDIIFVGEIRDLETAQVAVQAAMTGHLVLATLHTNDAVASVSRLMDLGLDRADIAATMRGAVGQRLVRAVCTECAQPVTSDLTDEESRLAESFGMAPVVRATGCARCANTGYFGRVPIQEVAVFTPAMLEQLAQGASVPALHRLAVSAGMRTLRAAALERVARGETTLAEIERVVGDSAGGSQPAGAGEITIFVADDNPVERLLVSRLLEKAGYQVVQTEDGESTLKRLTNGEPCSLLITDLHMGKVNGDELLRKLRAHPRTALLPVMVITGSAELDVEAELIEAGADDYIRKPVEPARLVARVRAALRRAPV